MLTFGVVVLEKVLSSERCGFLDGNSSLNNPLSRKSWELQRRKVKGKKERSHTSSFGILTAASSSLKVCLVMLDQCDQWTLKPRIQNPKFILGGWTRSVTRLDLTRLD